MSIQKHIKAEEKVEKVKSVKNIEKEADMKIKKLLQEKPKKKRSLWARLTKR